jgi:acetyl-CoA acetyltransferase
MRSAWRRRAIRAGDCDFVIAGGVESMTRAPFVMPKADSAFSAAANAVYDTTIGWRFVNPKMKAQFGVDSMPQTADNVAADFHVSRADQDAFAARSRPVGRPPIRRGSSRMRSCRW